MNTKLTVLLLVATSLLHGGCTVINDNRSYHYETAETVHVDFDMDIDAVLKEVEKTNNTTPIVVDRDIDCEPFIFPDLRKLPPIPDFENTAEPIEESLATYLGDLRKLIKEDRKKLKEALNSHYKTCGE